MNPWSIPSIVVLYIVCVRTHKILLHPIPFMSHCMEMVAIGDELIKRGHEVSLFAPDWFDHKKCIGDTSVKSLSFTVNTTKKSYLRFLEIQRSLKHEVFTGKFSIFTSIGLGEELVSIYCHSFLEHNKLLLQMKEDGYDLTIEDGRTVSQCLYLLPVTLGVPYVSISSLIHHDMSGGVFPGTFYPHIASSFSSHMSSIERIINMFTYIFAPAVVWVFSPTFDKYRYGGKYSQVDMTTLSKKSLLFIENADYVLDYPKALFPNVVQVGGLTVSPPKPLPTHLQTYFEKSSGGIIVASLGSLIPDLPYYVVEELMDALSRIQMNVLFKLQNGKAHSNIKYVNWFPQNDALAHRNTKLFVSHCGINGFYEALYNGVPIICFPLHGDHFQMAIKVDDNKVGRSLNIHTAKSKDIMLAIQDVLTNTIYRDNMVRNMKMIKDRAESPRRRAVRALEHVLKFGAEHLTPQSRDLNMIQMANAELWFIVYVTVTFLIIVCYRLSKGCRRRKSFYSRFKSIFKSLLELLHLSLFALRHLSYLLISYLSRTYQRKHF